MDLYAVIHLKDSRVSLPVLLSILAVIHRRKTGTLISYTLTSFLYIAKGLTMVILSRGKTQSDCLWLFTPIPATFFPVVPFCTRAEALPFRHR